MKIGLCQINPTVGDFAGNCARIERATHQAVRAGAHLVVFSELVVCGYPPEDLLLRRSFLEAHDRALADLAASLPPDVPVLVGCLARNESAESRGGRPLYNAVALLEDGLPRIVARKSLLPTYDVFDELRYFEPWRHPERNLVEVHGRRIGIVVCEDSWNEVEFFGFRRYDLDPMQRLVDAGAELLINLSASPWRRGLERFRLEMVGTAARRHGVPIFYVNQVGGNVALQFDGASFAIDSQGGLAFEPVLFEEAVRVVDLDEPWSSRLQERPDPEMHYRALVQGVRDYAGKFGFPRAVLGLSGGIDSSVTAVLAADALGPENVVGLMMPSRYSSEQSLRDARALAHNLGIEHHVLSIESLRETFEGVLAPIFAGAEPNVAEENVQARARAVLLMAYSNKFGHILLTTGNKSEAAVGYCTLYGDMAGALAVIADLWKTEVYALARWINRDGERIPEPCLTKPPSAELRPGQVDRDSLPPYEVLDPVLRCLVEQELPVQETARRTGTPLETVAWIWRQVVRSEFKRYQYAPTLRVSDRCWGGRRMPVCHRFEEDGAIAEGEPCG